MASGTTEIAPPLAASTEPPQKVSPRKKPVKRHRGFFVWLEASLSRLSTRNNFFHRLCSLIWLPYAYRSGIKMKQVGSHTFQAILPFRRFNKNWYNAMAGAALLGNSEIAGGMFVFRICGGDYTVVCKHLEYRFMRPCFGPALYRITPREDVQSLVEKGGEFNITLDMDVVQMLHKPEALGGKEKRVGRTSATFHVTPKSHQRDKKARRASADPATEGGSAP